MALPGEIESFYHKVDDIYENTSEERISILC